MATDIGGLFMTPEQYQMAQDELMRARALEYARLTPEQQTQYGFYQGGQQLGRAIGGALGGEDPQLKLIAQRQALLGQLDQSNPESYLQVAQLAARTGDPQMALALSEFGRKAASDLALIQQRTAEKMTNEQRNALAYADSIAPRGTPEHSEAYQSRFETLSIKPEATSQEMKNATAIADSKFKRNTPEWNTEYTSQLIRLTTKEPKELPPNIKEIGVAEGTREPVYLDVNTDTQYIYKKGAEGKQVRVPYVGGVDRTTAKVSATASAAGEAEFTKALGKLDAEKVGNAMTLRDNAISALDTLERLNKLDQQGLISGAFASGRVGAANILATVGLISQADQSTLANSQNYQKTSGDLVLATLGGRLGSGFSNEDRKFILGLVPQLETNALARKQLIEFMVQKNQKIVEETTRLETYARENKSLKGFVPKIPILNLGTKSTGASGMTDQQLIDALKAQGVNVKPKAK